MIATRVVITPNNFAIRILAGILTEAISVISPVKKNLYNIIFTIATGRQINANLILVILTIPDGVIQL